MPYLKVRKYKKVRRKLTMIRSTLTNKGQITIPKSVRDCLGLKIGDKLEFVITKSGEAFIRPVTKTVDDVFGRLHNPRKKPVSIEEMDAGIKQKMRKAFK